MARKLTKRTLLALLAFVLPVSAHAGGSGELIWSANPVQFKGYWGDATSHGVVIDYIKGDTEGANVLAGTTPWFTVTGDKTPDTFVATLDGTLISGGGKAQKEQSIVIFDGDLDSPTNSHIAPVQAAKDTDGEVIFVAEYHQNEGARAFMANSGYEAVQQFILAGVLSEHGVPIIGKVKDQLECQIVGDDADSTGKLLQWATSVDSSRYERLFAEMLAEHGVPLAEDAGDQLEYYIAGDDAGGAGKLLQWATFVGSGGYKQTAAAKHSQHGASIAGYGEDPQLYYIAGDDAGGAGKLLRLAALQGMELDAPNGFGVTEFSRAWQ